MIVMFWFWFSSNEHEHVNWLFFANYNTFFHKLTSVVSVVFIWWTAHLTESVLRYKKYVSGLTTLTIKQKAQGHHPHSSFWLM